MNAFEQRRLAHQVPPAAHGAFAFAGRHVVDPLEDLTEAERREVLDPSSYDPSAAHTYTVRDLQRALGLDSIETL